MSLYIFALLSLGRSLFAVQALMVYRQERGAVQVADIWKVSREHSAARQEESSQWHLGPISLATVDFSYF